MAAIGAVFPNAALDGMRRRHIWRRSDASDCDMQGLIRRRILDALRTDFGRIDHAFRMRCGSRIVGEGRRAERAVLSVPVAGSYTRVGNSKLAPNVVAAPQGEAPCSSADISAIEGLSVAVRMTKMRYRFHTQESTMIPNRARVVAGTSTIGRGASR